MMFSFPVSLMFGITGIFFDRRKLLAIISALIAAVPMIIFLSSMVLRTAFH